jgi:hypothetical protein
LPKRVRLSVELGGCDAEPGCGCAGVQAAVPDGDNEAWVADGQGAGEVYRVGAAQSMAAGEPARVLLDSSGELYRAIAQLTARPTW